MMMKASFDLANKVQHARAATIDEAAIVAEATVASVQLQRASPPDFPTAEFDAAELQFRARTGTSPIAPALTWSGFSGGGKRSRDALAREFLVRCDEEVRDLDPPDFRRRVTKYVKDEKR
jgi:hypothetical protein